MKTFVAVVALIFGWVWVWVDQDTVICNPTALTFTDILLPTPKPTHSSTQIQLLKRLLVKVDPDVGK
jgi:hypothetical protein